MSNGNYYNDGLLRDLRRYFGETVTIYTTSGGDSGSGFTGVLIGINCNFVRLLSDIGPAPACSLGSCCDSWQGGSGNNSSNSNRDMINCGLKNIGAIVDIPVNRIAAFVHNAI